MINLTTRQIEGFYPALNAVREREPDLPEGEMINHQLWLIMARVAIEMDIIDEYPKGTDIDDIHPAVAVEIGREFNEAHTEATTIPKKNG